MFPIGSIPADFYSSRFSLTLKGTRFGVGLRYIVLLSLLVSFSCSDAESEPRFTTEVFSELSPEAVSETCSESVYESRVKYHRNLIQTEDDCVDWFAILAEAIPNAEVKPYYECWQGSLTNESILGCDIGCRLMPKDDCERLGCLTETAFRYNEDVQCNEPGRENLYCYGTAAVEPLCSGSIFHARTPDGDIFVAGFCSLPDDWNYVDLTPDCDPGQTTKDL